VALLFDGRHYFESCQKLCALILAVVSMKPDAVAATELALRNYIMLDGPILPAVFGSAYAFLGHVPTSSDWSLILWVQTSLHALAAVLVFKLAFQLSRNKTIAYICAACWAFYPSAIIASGRLMTESIAVVLLLSLPLALRGAVEARSTDTQSASLAQKLSESLSGNKFAFAAGILSGLLILLKPGMIPSVVLSWLACLLLTKIRVAVALTLIVGAVFALTPWLLYTKQTTGKASITVQRMPVHNALIGWDPETMGWQTNPPSGFEHALNTGGEPLSTIEGIWLSHPRECLEILAQKFGHLYSTPWNDYRAKALFLNAEAQGIYHYLLLLAGLTGLFSWILGQQRKNKLAILCVAAASGQGVYLMFEPVCRYAFPIFAFAPVLLAIALNEVKSPSKNRRVAITAVTLALGFVGLIALSESSSPHLLTEQSQFFKPGEKAIAKISYKSAATKNATAALLLVDGDKNLEDSQVTINGHKCEGSLLPFNYYDPQRYQAFNLLKELGYGLNVKVDDFRVWRGIPIPIGLVKNGNLEAQITAGTNGCTIYGDNKESRRYLSPDFLCVNRLINSKTSMEMRNESAILSAQSTRIWGQQTAQQTVPSTDRPRVRLLLADSNPAAANISGSNPAVANPLDSNPGDKHPVLPGGANVTPPSKITTDSKEAISPFAKILSPSDFDENLRTPEGPLKISKSILKAARTTGTSINIPDFKDSTNLEITVSGQLRAANKTGNVGIVVETITNKRHECLLARLPSSIQTTKEWTNFEIKDLAPYLSREGTVRSISVVFFPGPWQQIAGYGCDKSCTDTLFRDLKLEVKPSSLQNLSDKHLSYF
jgi:hypothetical protein